MTTSIPTDSDYQTNWRQRREDRIQAMLPDEEDDLNQYDTNLLWRLFTTFVTPYRSELVWALVLITVSSLLSVSLPWLIGQAVDQGIEAGNLTDLRFWTIAFVLAAIGEGITNRGRIYIMARVGSAVVADTRSTLFRHLHSLTLNFHNNYSVGRMMSRLLGDITVIRDFITWSITGLFRSFFALFGIVIAMLVMNWQLALVSFCVLPIMFYAANIWRKLIRLAYRRARAFSSLINGYFNESISGIRVTKSFNREKENGAFFAMLTDSYRQANTEATWLTALFFPSIDFVGSLSAALVVGFGGWLVLGDRLTAGVLIAFVLYVQRFFEPIRELAMRFNIFQAAMSSCERIFYLLDLEADLVDAPEAYPLPAINGRVVFDDVTFGYKEGEPILRHVDLVAEPGEQIALVGETGAGKSTIIRLLTRFYDINQGGITIDGHDIREVTQNSLRQQLGMVLQDTHLFSGSILDNIRYGRLDATDEEVIRAAEAVGADIFITRMPDSYQTDVGENGVNLSVGQRQILSFARTLLADPRILVLDEATSSVDTATEKQIQQALKTLLSGRTSFVIAHRLNTIVQSDKIVVLDRGEVAEMGTHEALLALGGRYYNLYTMQWTAQNG